MCCFLPLARWIRSNLDTDEGLLCSIIITEIIRWIVMGLPIFLTAWRYGELVGYTRFIPGLDLHLQYWILTSCIFLAGSLLVYLPLKIICVKFWRRARYEYGWRPSIVIYILLCAMPCLVTLLISIIKSKESTPSQQFFTGQNTSNGAECSTNKLYMDEYTTAVIQIIILGLTLTEWMAKFRDEEMTFDLTNAMATDFFFAYDVIDFFQLSAYESEIFTSEWLYITFAMGSIAMVKYIPTQPTEMNENGTPKGAVTCIIVSMVFNDIPFVAVRVATMALFGLRVSDIIHPAKNVAMIFFGFTQLYIIHHNYKLRQRERVLKYQERRCTRKHTKSCRDRMDAGGNGEAVGNRMSGYSNDDCACDDEIETDLGVRKSVKNIKEAPPSQKRNSVNRDE